MPPSAFRVRRTGFSLVELIGVLSVLAIMAATAVPAVRALGETRSVQVVATVKDALRHARAAAVGLGTPCGVRFSTRTQQFELVTLTGGKAAPMADIMGKSIPATVVDPSGAMGFQRITGGSKSGNAAEIWVAETGGHASVSQSGVVQTLTRDATVLFTDGTTLTVHGTSGLIE